MKLNRNNKYINDYQHRHYRNTRNTIVLLCALSIMMALILPIAGSQVIQGWYSVAPWEIEMCTKYGGPVYDTSRSQSGVAHRQSIRATTVTIQFSKTERLDKSFIYEGAWYIHPITGSQPYTIALLNDTGTLKIAEGDAHFQRPTTSYWIKKGIAAEYTAAEVVVGGERFIVPVVCMNCEWR